MNAEAPIAPVEPDLAVRQQQEQYAAMVARLERLEAAAERAAVQANR